MARFPTQLGNVGPPRTQRETFRTSQPAEAFGVGIGQALQGLGGDVQQVAKQYEERENQANRYRALIDFTRFADRSGRALEEMKRDAPPGAPGFTKAAEEALRREAEEFLQNVPPELQDEFRMRLEPVVGSLVNDAFAFQIKSEDEKFVADFQVEQNKSFSNVHEMPEVAEQEAERLAELILESPLPDQTKQELITQNEQVLREAQFLGELERGYTTGTFEPLVVATDLEPEAPGFLNAIAGPESAGRYNVRFDGSPTGASFYTFDEHPNVPAPIPTDQGFAAGGQTSTAAGRYQFTYSTWQEVQQELNLPDFSPASQDKAAWHLAKKRYDGNLVEDLREAPGKVRRALVLTWEGLKHLTDKEFAEAIRQEAKIASGEFLPDVMNDERFDVLPPKDRLRLARKAKSVGEARRKEAQRQFLQGWDDEISFRRTNGRAPDDTAYTDSAIIELFPAEQASMLIAERDRALDDGRLFQSVQSATPVELQQTMEEAQSALDDPENHEMNLDRFNRLQKVVAARNKALLDDAPSYLIQTNTEIAALRQQLSEGGDAEAYAQAVLDKQVRLGVPQENMRVMGEELAAATLKSIQQTEADARGQAIVGLMDRWGDFGNEVVQELEEEGLSPFMYHAAINAQTNPGLAHEIAAAAALGKESRNAVPSEQHSSIEDAVRSNFSPFQEVFGAGDWTGNSLERMNEMREVANAVVMMRVANGGDAETEATRVYKQMVENNYHLVDGDRVKAWMPKLVGDMRLDPARIENVADRLLEADFVGVTPIEPFEIEPGAPEGVNEELTRHLIEDQGFWVTDSDAEGLTLMVSSGEDNRMALPVRTAEGNVVRLSFEQLMETNIPDDRNEFWKVIDDLFRRTGEIVGG